MGEIKSVKVDNWGVFFLQKLQNFFNKTDYCDMTLQFNDNSQLKVHRLVLSACTDYFNLLETNCELIDDALVMPNDLQADVVVPIVNFMYTGTLEFELNMYNKLLRTARDMNMTVLLKLLEAHRRTMEQTTAIAKPQQPTQIRGRGSYPSTQSPTKQMTIQKGISTQALGGRMITSNVSRRPTPAQRGNITIKEEAPFDPSPFEQLRQSGVNYKRPASKAYETPPEKKPSIEDVKEFAEQQRMRKQLAAADVGVSAEDEYVESYMEDEFAHDDEEEELNIGGSQITIKQEPNQKPTIVFKASADSKMDHAKIIGEVLKKYPHLIKNNKNLKLKIMPNTAPTPQAPPQPQRMVIKKEDIVQGSNKPMVVQLPPRPVPAPAPTVQKPPAAAQPKKIDSKTMHALIALGAENTTGPWLCLRCGVNGRPISIPSYRGFRRHLINTHREKIDSKLCEHCGYKSTDIRDLHFHVQVEHQITSTAFTFPRCEYCSQFFVTNILLNKHIEDSHTKNQQCIYCNEVYPKENDLYNHMKVAHKKQAQNDGVIDFSDGDDIEDENEFLTFNKVEDKKIKILSDISLPTTSVAVNEGTKFVAADGTEISLSEEQREQLMAQLDPNQEGGGIIMVLNESFSVPTDQVEEATVGIQQEPEPVQETQVEEKQEEDNMFVYKELNTEDEHLESKIDETVEEGNAAIDEDEKRVDEEEERMDVEEHEEEKHEEPNNSEDAKKLDEKLKMLTGEWSDDEPEAEDDEHANDSKDENIQEEQMIEEKADEGEDKETEDLDETIENEEKSKEDLEEGNELASPLKQELMDILGMENLEDSVLEKEAPEIKEEQSEQSEVKQEHEVAEEPEEVEQQIKEEVEEALLASKEEKSTAEEVEDELARLREEMGNVDKDNEDEKPAKEEKPSTEISDSDLQGQLEMEETAKVEEEETAEEESARVEVKQDDDVKSSEEKVEPEQSKDALKSIITDWADEGEGHDDDL